jgi:translocation and assembly module TamB
VEVGSVWIEWSRLRAVLTDFVIHGSEPAGVAPLLKIGRIEAQARLLPGWAHAISLRYLDIDSAAANVMVFADGRTNIPSPEQKSTGNENALEKMVDLAVSRFELTRGTFRFAEHTTPLSARGQNLVAGLSFQPSSQSYSGRLSVAPLEVVSGHNLPLNLNMAIPVELARDRITISNARVTAPHSCLRLSVSVENLHDPKFAASVSGNVSFADVVSGANLPPGVARIGASATADSRNIVVNDARIALGNSSLNASGALEDATGHGQLQFHTTLALSDLAALTHMTRSHPTGDVRLDGNATLRADQLQATATLRDLDTVEAARAFTASRMPYDGAVSGPIDVRVSLKSPGTTGLFAKGRLTITPGRLGIPTSGRVNATYDGATNSIALERSWLGLPHTHVELSGSTAESLRVQVISHDLADLQAPQYIDLGPGGAASVDATVRDVLKAPRIAGHLVVNRFRVEDRTFDSLSAEASASPAEIAVQNGELRRASLNAQFTARVGLRNWDPLPQEPLAVTASLTNGDLADVMALVGMKSKPYTGSLNATAQIGGTLANPQGSANLTVAQGTIDGEPFTRLQAQVNLSDRLVTIPAAFITAGANRIDLEASYRHSRDSFTTGSYTARVASNTISLSQVSALRKQDAPAAAGTVQLNADFTGSVGPVKGQTTATLTSVNGDASAKGVVFNGQDYGDLRATAGTSGNTVTYQLTSDFAGSSIAANGSTALTGDYPTTANVSIAHLPVQRVLAAARQMSIAAAGNLSGTAEITGTLHDPQGSADLSLTKAMIDGEQLDSVHCRVTYTAQSVDLPMLDAAAGPSHIRLSASYTHPRDNWQTGHAQFQLEPSHWQLAAIHKVQELRPGLAGTVQLSGNGEMQIQPPGARSRVRLSSLNLDAEAKGTTYGDATFAAHTTGGNLNFTLASNFTGADIRGKGAAQLTGDYPINAQFAFRNVTYAPQDNPQFRAAVDGDASIGGSVMGLDGLRGTVQLNRLEAVAKPQAGSGQGVVIRNQGPVVVALERSVMTLRSAHLTGPSTDISASGTVALNPRTLNLTLKAESELSMLHSIDSNIYSGGGVTLAAAVRGSFTQPLVSCLR